jgi:hypothetical protein
VVQVTYKKSSLSVNVKFFKGKILYLRVYDDYYDHDDDDNSNFTEKLNFLFTVHYGNI